MEIINIEQGHPNVQQAMIKLSNGIYRARATGKPMATTRPGTGGAIKQALNLELRKYIARGIIKTYCPGEDFGPFSGVGRQMNARHPETSRDSDWGMQNDGITVIMFK